MRFTDRPEWQEPRACSAQVTSWRQHKGPCGRPASLRFFRYFRTQRQLFRTDYYRCPAHWDERPLGISLGGPLFSELKDVPALSTWPHLDHFDREKVA